MRSPAAAQRRDRNRRRLPQDPAASLAGCRGPHRQEPCRGRARSHALSRRRRRRACPSAAPHCPAPPMRSRSSDRASRRHRSRPRPDRVDRGAVPHRLVVGAPWQDPRDRVRSYRSQPCKPGSAWHRSQTGNPPTRRRGPVQRMQRPRLLLLTADRSMRPKRTVTADRCTAGGA